VNQDDFEDDETPMFLQPGAHAEPLIWGDVACIGIRWVANVATCIEEVFSTTSGALHAVANCVGMDANYRRHQARFAREVGASIESITGPSSAGD
jgi:hypothetical protein